MIKLERTSGDVGIPAEYSSVQPQVKLREAEGHVHFLP